MNTKWAKEIFPQVVKELEFYKKEGFKPTVRTMFYRLFSKELIPNTRSSYGRLAAI